VTVEFVEETPERWRIEPHGAMRVPGIMFASKTLLPEVAADRSLEQVATCERAHLAAASHASDPSAWSSRERHDRSHELR
jgi:tRNA-splicing ligase RtcB